MSDFIPCIRPQSIKAEEKQEGLCPRPGSEDILWRSLHGLARPSLPVVVWSASSASLRAKDLLQVGSLLPVCASISHPHQVSSLHSHPIRFHSASFINNLLVAAAALSPAGFCGIQGSGEVDWEENWTKLGDWDSGLTGCVALRGHLASSSWLEQSVDGVFGSKMPRLLVQYSWNVSGLSLSLSGKGICLSCCWEWLVLRIVRSFIF